MSRVPPAWLWAVLLAVVLGLGFAPRATGAQSLPVPGKAAGEVRDEVARPGLWQRAVLEVRQAQQRLQRDLARVIGALKDSGSARAMGVLALMGFLYGVFHAVGPGHGKIVISSYLLAHEGRIRRGVELAFLSSLVQALSAIALVGVLAVLLDASNLETTARVRLLEVASYGLIVLIGLWMLAAAIAGKGCGHVHPHGDGGHRSSGGASGLGRLFAVVAAVGIRPCSGAVIVLLFTLAQGMFAAGVGATFAMAVGTAATVSVLAVLSVLSRRGAVRIAGANAVWEARIHTGLAVAGSLVICLFGVLLLLAALDPRSPF